MRVSFHAVTVVSHQLGEFASACSLAVVYGKMDPSRRYIAIGNCQAAGCVVNDIRC